MFPLVGTIIIARGNLSGMVQITTATQELEITMIHMVIQAQKTEVDSGRIIGAHDYTDIIMVIPELIIAMMVGPQAINIMSRMEKDIGMVVFTTITIPGVVPMTITIL